MDVQGLVKASMGGVDGFHFQNGGRTIPYDVNPAHQPDLTMEVWVWPTSDTPATPGTDRGWLVGHDGGEGCAASGDIEARGSASWSRKTPGAFGRCLSRWSRGVILQDELFGNAVAAPLGPAFHAQRSSVGQSVASPDVRHVGIGQGETI